MGVPVAVPGGDLLTPAAAPHRGMTVCLPNFRLRP
jgi:hypothetical protein